ncbi:MAG TPA: amino acid permease, partial [Prolixibacteraceae bacterium]|nr:amino acid permease [Prolixibacteraceae bacterium]
ISFLNHFGSSPSYRPSFKSKWFISLTGFHVAVWVMFKISTGYAFMSFLVMAVLYIYLSYKNKERKGFEALFANTVFQLNRNLHMFVQKQQKAGANKEWRPSAICISQDTFERFDTIKLLDWISYRYGFGTYLHLILGYYSKANKNLANEEIIKIKEIHKGVEDHVYIDSLISPSYTSAIAQAIQLPGISGMENNMVILDFDKETGKNLNNIIDNFALINAGCFDVCFFACSNIPINFKNGIHVWIKSGDYDNANLMILLSFIILGHPEWKKSSINIFSICDESKVNTEKVNLEEMVVSGRLPISSKNINIIPLQENVSTKSIINQNSKYAGLTIIGFLEETLKHEKESLFSGYDEIGSILFVNAHDQKDIS